jgi:hypothetical protein
LHAAAHRNQTLVVIAAVVMIVVAAEARRQHHITPTPSLHEPAACWTASRARRLFAGSSIGKHRSLVMATTASGLVPPIHFFALSRNSDYGIAIYLDYRDDQTPLWWSQLNNG